MTIKSYEIIEALSIDYAERWEDEDQMHPSDYDEWLEQQDIEDLLEMYNQLSDTEPTLEDIDD